MPYRIADKHKAFKDRLSVDINCTKVKVKKKFLGGSVLVWILLCMMLIAILKATIYHLSKSVYCDFADQSEVGAKTINFNLFLWLLLLLIFCYSLFLNEWVNFLAWKSHIFEYQTL